ncbi:hypothetical protein HUS23_14275 [Ectothiorhodospiraceae bacterium 2226]|nr:hypothetical protein HUS23_14275 [Ectothiorhodospiraceae bacterium 2226]
MVRIGRYTVYLGILLVAVGLIVGFGVMIMQNSGDAAAPWLALVPVGFLALLLGTVLTQLGGEED